MSEIIIDTPKISYYQKNKERILEYQKKYNKEHRQICNERNKKYDNKEYFQKYYLEKTKPLLMASKKKLLDSQ